MLPETLGKGYTRFGGIQFGHVRFARDARDFLTVVHTGLFAHLGIMTRRVIREYAFNNAGGHQQFTEIRAG
jgi:hypothetical protein